MTNIKHMGIVYEPVALGSIDSLNISINAKAYVYDNFTNTITRHPRRMGSIKPLL